MIAHGLISLTATVHLELLVVVLSIGSALYIYNYKFFRALKNRASWEYFCHGKATMVTGC